MVARSVRFHIAAPNMFGSEAQLLLLSKCVLCSTGSLKMQNVNSGNSEDVKVLIGW